MFDHSCSNKIESTSTIEMRRIETKRDSHLIKERRETEKKYSKMKMKIIPILNRKVKRR
jgi:hypothetical protein